MDHTVLPATHTQTIPAFTPQPQGITALWPVPTLLLGEQRHIGVRNLPRVSTPRARPRLEPTTSRSQVRHSTDSATTPPVSVAEHSFGFNILCACVCCCQALIWQSLYRSYSTARYLAVFQQQFEPGTSPFICFTVA